MKPKPPNRQSILFVAQEDSYQSLWSDNACHCGQLHDGNDQRFIGIVRACTVFNDEDNKIPNIGYEITALQKRTDNDEN